MPGASRGGWRKIRAPSSKPETKALWKGSRGARLPVPRREKRRAAPTARRLRGAPVPAAGVRERPSRPARRRPPRTLERGGGRRRHHRKFMAWVTCFPLPQWGPVTLNRKLMREERNLISPLCALGGEGLRDGRHRGRRALVRLEPRARALLPNSGAPGPRSWGWPRPSPRAPSSTGCLLSAAARAESRLLSVCPAGRSRDQTPSSPPPPPRGPA